MDDINKLKARLAHLEQVNRSRLMALEMLRDLGGLHESVNQLEYPLAILDKYRIQAKKLIKTKALAFYLVDERSSDFYMATCDPDSARAFIESEMVHFIEDGTFSRALLEKSPVTAQSVDFSSHFLFHALATASRVRGMCVAVLEGPSRQVPEAAFELFSILMTHCVNNLESHELYHQLRSTNAILEEKVSQLSRSQTYLQNEVRAHKKTLEALGRSEAQYRLLAETAREIIMTVSDRNRVTYINPYGLALAGYSPWDLEDASLGRLLKDDRGKPFYPRPHTMDIGTAFLKTSQGERIPLEISMAPVADPEGGSGVLIMGRNISNRLTAEAENKALEERLWQARKMESIGLLAGGTAHDFNNLLNIIFNYTDLALGRLEDGHPAAAYLDQVAATAKEARALARQLYTIGREDRHETHLLDMNRIMNRVVKLLRSSLGKKLTLESRPGERPLWVMAEETRIRQVLLNLITNAAHAMDQGSIQVGGDSVTLDSGPVQQGLNLAPGPYVRFWVKDTGPGIPSEVLPRIFEPYYSTKGDQGNAGLGLAVVHGIISVYKGAVSVETTPSQGSCFNVYLPEADREKRRSGTLSAQS